MAGPRATTRFEGGEATLAIGPRGLLVDIGWSEVTSGPARRFGGPLAGTLGVRLLDGDRRAEFVAPDGNAVLALAELAAFDAEGREVEARLELAPGIPGSAPRLDVVVPAVRGAVRAVLLLASAKRDAARTGDAAPAAGGTTAPAAPPTNDACAGAESIPPAGPFPFASALHDLAEASMTGDPVPGCQSNVSRGAWFTFTPAESGSYTFSLCQNAPTATTLPDTVLALFTSSTGACGGAMTQVSGGCDDDSCLAGELQSVLSANLAAGTTFFVVVYKYGSAAPPPGESTIQLRVSRTAPPPANDACAGAEVIPPAGPFPFLTSVTPDIAGAGAGGDPPAPSCQSNVSRSTWYVFAPAEGGYYSFSTCAGDGTATTVDDTVLAVYASTGGCAGPFTQVGGGCDDNSCAVRDSQALVSGIALEADRPYYVLVHKVGSAVPPAGHTAVQVAVRRVLPPANDTCAGAPALSLGRTTRGTTVAAADDVRLSGSACFTGNGQVPSTAPGRDVVYSFTAPAAGDYTFRLTGYATSQNPVLHVASDCPAGPPPSVIAGCLVAANRNVANGAEEAGCVALGAGQVAWVFVDDHGAAATGSPFDLVVERCARESEANNLPASANVPACGIGGVVAPAGDVDFFSLGEPEAGSRVFALADAVAANSTDFDLRVTTGSDTLEYDDADNDAPFGRSAPNVAGTPLAGGRALVKVETFSGANVAEPYRLYAVVQPPASRAAAEVEPNDTPATATTAPGGYFAGALGSSHDVDHFSFFAQADDVVFAGVDGDPPRDGTPFGPALALLDAAGVQLLAVDDANAAENTDPGPGLSARTPRSPGESLVYRVPTAGTYFARVSTGGSTTGDYLLSISRNCRIEPATDLAVTQSDAPDPVGAGGSVTYRVTVRNLGAADATLVELHDDPPPGTTLVGAVPSQGTCPASPPLVCHLGTIPAGASATVDVTVLTSSPGTIVNAARVRTMQLDTNGANDACDESTSVIVPETDSDLDGVPDTHDCRPNDPALWSAPSDAGNLRLAGGTVTTLLWDAPSDPGGIQVLYDALRSGSPSGFGTPTCLVKQIPSRTATDPDLPYEPGEQFLYLVRSVNGCGSNSGTDSGGSPRSTGPCP